MDLEKVYDSVPGEEQWFCIEESRVAEKYVRLVHWDCIEDRP